MMIGTRSFKWVVLLVTMQFASCAAENLAEAAQPVELTDKLARRAAEASLHKNIHYILEWQGLLKFSDTELRGRAVLIGDQTVTSYRGTTTSRRSAPVGSPLMPSRRDLSKRI